MPIDVYITFPPGNIFVIITLYFLQRLNGPLYTTYQYVIIGEVGECPHS